MDCFEPPAPARPTVTHADCVFAEHRGYRPLRMDVHLPVGDGPFPVVAWIHGGAWQGGRRDRMPDVIAPHDLHGRMVTRGYAVADLEYRLALEAPYPAQLADVQSGLRWLRRFARELRLDPGRVATMGDSAGGHLAAMAGLAGSGDAAVQAVINWYGVTDLEFRDPDDAFTEPSLLLGGAVGTQPEFARWASPVHRVHAGAPPFLSVHGTADAIVPFSHAERLTEALRAVGVRADLLPVPDADHCFEGYDDIGGLIEAGIDFLDEVL